MMAAPLLEIPGLGKRFGGFVALDGIDLAVGAGERVGLIGPNGSGKSTLVNCICGTLTNETGTVRFDGESLERAAGARAHPSRPGAQLPAAAAVHQPHGRREPARAAGLHRQCAARHAPVGRRDRRALRRAARSSSASPTRPTQLPRDLTQVEMRKLELARALAAEPKLLIADESMAGLSQAEVADIVALLIDLNERGITIILIEHIMRAVMSFSQRLVVLVSGKKIADGAPDVVIRDPEVERAYLGQ